MIIMRCAPQRCMLRSSLPKGTPERFRKWGQDGESYGSYAPGIAGNLSRARAKTGTDAFPATIEVSAPAKSTNATYFSRSRVSALIVGRSPWTAAGRPRRPARALHDADPVVPAAGRGRPVQSGGAAPHRPPMNYTSPPGAMLVVK